jgi:hypothetical protein
MTGPGGPLRAAACWGIFRERAHSPGREGDDAEILRLTGKHLEAEGFQVVLKSPEELSGPFEARPRGAFLMCERIEALRVLHTWEAGGAPLVNRPEAVLNTYRATMIRRLAAAGLPFVESRLVPTSDGLVPGRLPVWVKRADVHNTREGDVVFASTSAAVGAALRGLAARGIADAVIQPHLEGDLVKFYGIGVGEPPGGGARWFRWFYPKDQRPAGHPFDAAHLTRLAGRAAAALGLEIYGGDALVTADGSVVLLDLNAWPSFALYRDEAAAHIAAYLVGRFAEVPR